MSAIKRWRGGVVFHGVACWGMLILSGCGGGIGTSPTNVQGDDRDTLGLDVDNYHLAAAADPEDPASYSFSVTADSGASLAGLTLTWDLGDGPLLTGPEQTFRFDGPGRYEVTLTATDENGDVVLTLTREVEVVWPTDGALADAGEPQTVDENANVYLFAGNTWNPTGAELTYFWSQLEGPDVLILDDDLVTASFIAPLVDTSTELVFEVVVSDGTTMSSDDVVVTVEDVGGEGATVSAATSSLTANAGADLRVSSLSTVTLDGTRSSGPANSSPTFRWRQTSGPTVVLQNSTRPRANFVAPLATTSEVNLSFRLTVTSGSSRSTDSTNVTVTSSDPCVGDADDDGVNDCDDLCSSDPTKSSPGACGCGVADTDTDGDGTPDCLDDNTIPPAAVLVAFAGNDVSIALGSSASLPGSASGGVTPYTYSWSPSTGLSSSTIAQPTATPTATTTYTLTVTDADGDVALDTVTVTVTLQAPLLLADAGADRTMAAGGSVTLNGSASGGTAPFSYRWSPTTGLSSSTVAQPTASPTVTTTYTLTVTDGDGQTASDSAVLTVQAPALVASAGADRAVTAGGSTTLSGSASGGTSPYTYRWSPTTGLSSSTVAAPTATPTSTTIYTLTVTDAASQTASDSVTVTVNSPALVANAGPDRTVTSGSSASLTGSASGGTPPYTYRWTPTTALSNPNIASPTAAPTATTTYTLTVTDAASRTASDSAVVTVQQAAAALSVGSQSLSFGSSSTTMTFEVWNSGGGTLTYNLSDNASWLSLSPTSGTSTGEHDSITATVSRTGLANNPYNGVITVTPTVGTALTIAVTMTVGGATGGSMTSALRTTGVAPLAVIFDAVQSGSGVAAPPLSGARRDYASYHYAWDFGDPTAGTWTNSGKSKNEATGFVAAHVFETPGTFQVRLDVTDNTGSMRTYQQTITVQDPEVVFANSSADAAERTIYVSASGNDSNNGSFNRPVQTWSRARTMLFASNGPRRVLLRRGDTFTHASGNTVNGRTGPFQIGAYGSGANPVINSSDSSGGVLVLDATATDVRIMDVEMFGNTAGPCIRPGNNTLALRCRMSNFGNGVTTSEAHGLKQGVVIADSSIDNNDRYGIYFNFGQHDAFLGNLIDDVNGEHLVRCYLTHSLVQHNIFRNGHPAKHQLKFVGYFPTGNPDRAVGTPTETVEFSIISDNTFERSGPIQWMVALGPVDNTKDQRMQDVIFERNLLRADSGTEAMLYANNHYITVRNNVFDASLKPEVNAIRITNRGVEPPPVGYNVLNNTFYTSSTGAMTCVQVDAVASQTTVRNNFGAIPSGGTMIGGGGSGLVQSNNVLATSGGFANAAAGDFRLTAASTAAIDAGASVPQVFEDKMKVRRNVNGDGRNGAEPDAGAFEYVP